jgi:hypothetical protein
VAIFVGTEPGLYGPMGSGRIEIVGGEQGPPAVDAVMAAVEGIS